MSIHDLLKETFPSVPVKIWRRGNCPTGSNGPVVQVDSVIPVEPCVEKLLLSVECFCKEVHTVKESNTYLLVKVIHRTFAASQNVVKPWIWIFSYENVAKVIHDTIT